MDIRKVQTCHTLTQVYHNLYNSMDEVCTFVLCNSNEL